MPTKAAAHTDKQIVSPPDDGRVRKHVDYQRVYREGKRQSLPLMTFFFAVRNQAHGTQPHTYAGLSSQSPPLGPRVGLTAGRVLGNAVERNRIKRRMREAVRHHRKELTATVDVILHPRRTVLQAEFSQIEHDVCRAFRAVQMAMEAAMRPIVPGNRVQSSQKLSKSTKVAKTSGQTAPAANRDANSVNTH